MDDDLRKSFDLKITMTLLLLTFLCVLFVYLYKFHSLSLSSVHEDWGAFGSYLGGVLSPIVAGLAVYLIAKTYNLQKNELKELKDAQLEQLKLSALTSLLNSNLTQINIFQTEETLLLRLIADSDDKQIVGRVQSLAVSFSCGDPDSEGFEKCMGEQSDRDLERKALMREMDYSSADRIHRIWGIKAESEELINQNIELKSKIEKILKQ
ncbi:MAG: hypothetical protein KAQ91_06265 [Methylococcales bacterium]|nr:hypothetical protein [Methylococcales bacterium]